MYPFSFQFHIHHRTVSHSHLTFALRMYPVSHQPTNKCINIRCNGTWNSTSRHLNENKAQIKLISSQVITLYIKNMIKSFKILLITYSDRLSI